MVATVLAIDQGTSGTKAIVMAGNEVVSSCEVPIRPDYRGGGAVEQDPMDLLASVLEAGRLAVKESGVQIDVVSIANQGESVLAWDRESGSPLTPIVVWQDRRADALCQELADQAAFVAERTGLVLDPYFSAPKQAWIRRNMTREGVVTTSDAWLLHQLTGEFVSDVTTASRSLVFDIDTCAWDPDLLEVFGLQDEPLPRLVSCDSIVGETSAFGGLIPVGGLVVDQQAALLAEHCLEPGEAKCTFGTGAFLLANIGQHARRSSAGLSTSVAWQVGNTVQYCLDGQVYAAASAVHWLAELGFIEDAAGLDDACAQESGGVIAVPALAGLAAPWWRAEATASFHGMSLSTRPGHLVRATIEGIAAQVAEICEVVEADLGAPLTYLRVDGGLTRSEVLMQVVADLAQVPVEVYPTPNATALGAVALARLSVHPAMTLADAVVPWVAERAFEPQWSVDRAAAFRQDWLQAAERS